jgi:hypothetical protein
MAEKKEGQARVAAKWKTGRTSISQYIDSEAFKMFAAYRERTKLPGWHIISEALKKYCK